MGIALPTPDPNPQPKLPDGTPETELPQFPIERAASPTKGILGVLKKALRKTIPKRKR